MSDIIQSDITISILSKTSDILFCCSLIGGLFAAAVVLISFGVYMGKVSRLQLLVICVIEIVMYAVNEFILLDELQVADIGGSMLVHLFACYFGMAVTFVLRRPDDIRNNPKEVPIYQSDLFAMIGNTFCCFCFNPTISWLPQFLLRAR